jgi:hypothetical protein
MGMRFTVTLQADFSQDLDADDLISVYDVDADMLGIGGTPPIAAEIERAPLIERGGQQVGDRQKRVAVGGEGPEHPL